MMLAAKGLSKVNLFTLSVMEKLSKRKLWQAAASLACAGVLRIRLNAFGASEFSGGRITGKLSQWLSLARCFFSWRCF
jgi:hypothetical protein